MTDPLSPNYKKDIGRLVTDRFDFQKHINGEDFRHTASTIDLFPTVVIASNTYTTVQSALQAISTSLSPPVIQDATGSVKGILKLTSDLGGSADFPQVIGLRTVPISTSLPSNNDVLVFNGTFWAPGALSSTFIIGGDLTGTSGNQTVVSLTGDGFNNVNVIGTKIQFISTVTTPTINQAIHATAAGKNLLITAQATNGSGQNGGDVVISGGAPGSGGLRGGTRLQINGSNLLQTTEVVSGQRVLGLTSDTAITSTNMPASTGDLVVYVGNAATNPAANPSGGAILYASAGKLNVRQQDGSDFVLGAIPNPSLWGDTGQQTYTARNYSTTTGSSPNLAFSYAIPVSTAVKIDTIIIGKKVGSTDSVIFNLSDGYVRESGSPVQMGASITSADPRVVGGATSWTIPTISISGNTLQVYTGANTATSINWFVVIQLAIILG